MLLTRRPRARNLWTFSEALDNAVWTATNASVSANAGTQWDGSAGADKLVEDALTNTHWTTRTMTGMVANCPQIIALDAKPSGRNSVGIQTVNLANQTQTSYVNASTGAITPDANHVVTAALVGNGYYRITVRFLSGSGATAPLVRLFLVTGTQTTNYAGDGASGVLICRAQYVPNVPVCPPYATTSAGTVG